MRRIDIECEVDGADFLLHQIDEIGGIPRDSARKKQFFEEVITGIGGWPDRMPDQGVTLNGWRMNYHRYLGLTEACNMLGWKPEDQGRNPEEVFSFLGGETQRAINVPPQPSIPHVQPIK